MKDLSQPVFLDTGFMRRLCSPSTSGRFAQNLESDPVADWTKNWTPWRTALVYLEWIGINSRKLTKPKVTPILSPVDHTKVNRVFGELIDHFKNCDVLSPTNVREAAQIQRRHVAHAALHIWDAATTGIFTAKGIDEWIPTFLAVDHLQKLDIDEECASDLHSELLANSFFTDNYHIRCASKYRLAASLWKRAWPLRSKKSQAALKHFNELVRLKNPADLADTDLIHVATLGAEFEDGSRRPVLAATLDRPEVIIGRLGLYKGLLTSIREKYAKEASACGFGPQYAIKFNGVVQCFDLTGRVSQTVDVQQDAPALPWI